MTTQKTISETLAALPDSPGIYLYYSAAGELIYVGKATSLRSRVKSYFRGQRTPRPIEEMIHEVARIETKVTESVLEAVILEAIYIKKHQPKYNVLGKDSKSWNYIAFTNEPYPAVVTVRQHEVDLLADTPGLLKKKYSYFFGPFPGLNTRAAMKILRRLFRFSTCRPGATRPCLYYEMGQCLGVCIGAITETEYERMVLRPLRWFLLGKKKAVLHEFAKQMKAAAKGERYEEAARLRDQLSALQRIHDVTLIDKSFFENEIFATARGQVQRVEGYDISNLGASDKVASMVVFNAHGPVKSEYRKFNIKTVIGQSDVDSLAEVLSRRFKHSEWQRPDAILIDGGRPQVNKVKKVFKELGVTVPFVGIAKGPERKRNDFIVGTPDKKFIEWVSTHREFLIQVRDEAHRFAITFNRSKRKIKKS